MARGTFKCGECSDSVYFNVGKNRRDTDRHASWLESQGALCGECKEKERQAQNAANAEKNASAGLPSLTGTEKMIAWAETIRSKKFEYIQSALNGTLDPLYFDAFWGTQRTIWSDEVAMSVQDPHLDYCIDLLKQQTSASWWIDNRETKIGFMLKDLFIKHPPLPEEPPEVIESKVEAQIEATVRPENPLTETIAEIRVHDKSVEIVFPEKREDFWQIVKKQLGYEWSGSVWKRTLVATNGTPADRAAEAGNKLLSAGFIIRIFDPAIREAAIGVAFEQECIRWIKVRTTGTYTGWFVPTWPGRDEALYNAARKIKGSKYDKPWVVAPPEQFEAVLDFATMYGFRITPAAMDALIQARKTRDAALVAKPVKVAREQLPVPGDKPAKLAVPEQVEVADEFKD